MQTHLEAISLKEAFSSCLSRNGSRQELCTAWMHCAMLAASLKPSVALPVPLVLASGCCWSVSTAGVALIGSKPARTHRQVTNSTPSYRQHSKFQTAFQLTDSTRRYRQHPKVQTAFQVTDSTPSYKVQTVPQVTDGAPRCLPATAQALDGSFHDLHMDGGQRCDRCWNFRCIHMCHCQTCVSLVSQPLT